MEKYLIRLLMKVSFNVFLIIFSINIFTQVAFANYSEAQSIAEVQVSLSVEQASLEEIIETIEHQTEFKFAYLDKTARHKKYNISIEMEEQSVENVLQEVSQQTGLSFRQVNETISIKKTFGVDRVVAYVPEDPGIQDMLTISGTVKNEEGEPLPGVSVYIKGTTIGITTNFDGNYSFNAPVGSEILVFSFIGMTTQEVNIDGRTSIDVVLKKEALGLDEVVVTALGIKRAEKALGYAVQKVDGEKLAEVKEIDVLNALSGKVSGVNVIQADGAIGGGGSRVVIRGEGSLAGNNDPLYIINGVKGSANDIAADDIESISVLKGPAAAALYGAKAGGGVIIITSKSAKRNTGISIDINSSIMFQTPLVLPEYQNKYGMGESGEYSYYNGNGDGVYDDTKYNWGPEFDGELRCQFTGKDPWVAYPDNVKDFYETGHIYTNNISVANATEKGNYRFSYTNTDQKGIMPNNGLTKNSFALNSSFNILKGLTLTTNVNYLRTNCKNNKTVDVRFIPRSINIAALKDYWVPGMEDEQQMNYRRSGNNPYFVLYENPYSYIDSKVIVNATLNYDINKHWTVLGRFGTNITNSEYEDKHAKSTYSSVSRDLNGYYSTGLSRNREITAEFLASYSKTFFDVLNMKVSFGGTHYRTEYKKLYGSTYELTYTGIYNLDNRDGYLEDIDDYKSEKEENSLYAFLNLDYKGMVFLDITNRDDWSSTLHPSVNHFTYPSATLSVLFSEMFELPDYISFLKLRGSVAEVGNSIPSAYYTIENKYTYSNYNGLTNLDPTDVTTDPYLKPESIVGYEAGLDFRLFDNRIGIDAAFYYSKATDNILRVSKSTTSGGESSETINAGQVDSKGVEVTLTATPVKTNNFSWDLTVNWSLDRTEVKELLDSDPTFTKTQQVNSFLAIEDRAGQRRGTFYGKSYERAPNGERLYNLSGDTRLTDETELGNYNPDWMGSINNTLRYKNLSLSFLLDLRWGGLIYNEIERKLNMYGLSKATLLNDRENIVPHGMVEDDEADGGYRWLTLDDLVSSGKSGGQSGQEYWANQMEEVVPENELIDDTYLKLRELRIAYTLPNRFLKNSFIHSLSLALVGRNLAVWSKVKHIDPETFGYSSDTNDFGGYNKVPGYANSSVPSVRSYGFTVNCKF